jgi:hypothetical protein
MTVIGPADEPSAVTVSLSAGASIGTIDDALAGLADEVSGFGGLFVDEAGRLRVFMKRRETFAGARPRLEAFMLRLFGGRREEASRAHALVEGASVHPAAYSYRELLTAYRGAFRDHLQHIDGLVSTDTDERLNRIVVGVRNGELAERARRQFSAIGLGDSIVTVQVEEGLRPNALLTDELRPVPGGAQIELLDSTCHRTLKCGH